tara:strand:- start:212 stop:949 length:738 start_codon:yes stop_codon:yes gene_type:complete
MGLGLGNSLSSPVYPQQTTYAVTRSVDLDGTDDHIIITNSVADDIKNIGSVSIWFKSDAAFQNDTLFNLHTDTSNDNKIALLHVTGDTEIRLNCRGSSSNTIINATHTINTSNWVHVVATWNRTDNRMAIYINGSSAQTGTNAIANFATTANKIYLGKPGNADNAFFDGHLSSLSLFDAALSASNVTTLYNDGKPGDVSKSGISSLVAWLPLDETSGNFIDRTSTGADGVPTNIASSDQGVEDTP